MKSNMVFIMWPASPTIIYNTTYNLNISNDMDTGKSFSVIVTLVIVSALLFSWIYLLSLIIYLLSLIIYLLSLIIYLLSLIKLLS